MAAHFAGAGDRIEWPCGCVTECVETAAGEREFRIRPCSPECDVLAEAVRLSVERGNAIEVRDE